MTTNSGPRVVRADTATADGQESPLLDQVRDVALRLLSGDGRPATALRVRVGDIAVELEWPENPAPAGPTSVAVVGQAAAAVEQGDDVEDTGGEPSGGWLTAHTVGCFYRRPSPDAPPFVNDGDVVAAGQQVAIIEAMKLMLPVEVERACRIGSALVEDGDAVEFGDLLFTLESLDEDG